MVVGPIQRGNISQGFGETLDLLGDIPLGDIPKGSGRPLTASVTVPCAGGEQMGKGEGVSRGENIDGR